jgi:hypothetical protein
LAGVHEPPAVHATHEPLSHTSLVPQFVPLVRFETFAVQAETPVAHDVVPFWQAAGVHAVPAVHAAHAPLSQTSFWPHDVPFAMFELGTQTGMPLVQEIIPFWQALAEQAMPDMHVTHEPLLQTWLVPQDVPLATGLMFAVQADVPVAHDVTPVVHALAMHAVPAVQVMHDPPLQTWLEPHAVPLARFDTLPVQAETPVAHDVVPVWHALGLQAVPEVHATQVPPMHTWFDPHDVPSATFVAVPLQTSEPVEQDVVAVWQALPLG